MIVEINILNISLIVLWAVAVVAIGVTLGIIIFKKYVDPVIDKIYQKKGYVIKQGDK